MKKALRGPLVYVAIILAIVLLTSSFGALGNTDKRELGYTDFMTQVKEGKFSKITVVGYNAYGMLKEGSI